MRREEFKMERTGLLEVGDVLPITEGKTSRVPIIIHLGKHMQCLLTMR